MSQSEANYANALENHERGLRAVPLGLQAGATARLLPLPAFTLPDPSTAPAASSIMLNGAFAGSRPSRHEALMD